MVLNKVRTIVYNIQRRANRESHLEPVSFRFGQVFLGSTRRNLDATTAPVIVTVIVP